MLARSTIGTELSREFKFGVIAVEGANAHVRSGLQDLQAKVAESADDVGKMTDELETGV